MTSEEVMFHIPWKPLCLTQHVQISFNKPPIKRSSELFWPWTITSNLLDLHATSHDAAPPRNLKLAVSATDGKEMSENVFSRESNPGLLVTGQMPYHWATEQTPPFSRIGRTFIWHENETYTIISYIGGNLL